MSVRTRCTPPSPPLTAATRRPSSAPTPNSSPRWDELSARDEEALSGAEGTLLILGVCGGGLLEIDRLLVDSDYKPEVVAAVKQKAGGSTMMLSKGVGVRANRKPFAALAKKGRRPMSLLRLSALARKLSGNGQIYACG